MFGNKNKNKYKKTFNLLYTAERDLDGWEKIYVWLSGTCRIVIIGTLLIIIISFGFRFANERELNDLKESSETLSFRLKSYEKRQKDITSLQNSIESYNKTWKTLSNYSKVIDEIFALNPLGIDGLNLAISPSGISISGSGGRDAVSNAEITYKNSPLFINFTLNSLSSKGSSPQSSIYSFDLTGDFATRIVRNGLLSTDNAK